MVLGKFDASLNDGILGFLPKSGRALAFPVYKSTFSRGDDYKPGMSFARPAMWREHLVLWSKDLGRTLDYLQGRKDVDNSKLAYFGFSWGAEIAPVLLAVDDRFRAAILMSGGIRLWAHSPQAEPVNFIRRVTIPVLMLNERYDNIFPVETSQLPLYRLLGTPENDRKYVLYDTGHGMIPRKDLIRETLDWLDRYLGPVKRPPAS